MHIIRPRILIAEDERVTAVQLERMLQSIDCEVSRTASSGEEAVRAAAELTPDLVLMDIVPEGNLDGIEAARKIIDTLDIPVIYLAPHGEGRHHRARQYNRHKRDHPEAPEAQSAAAGHRDRAAQTPH